MWGTFDPGRVAECGVAGDDPVNAAIVVATFQPVSEFHEGGVGKSAA